MPGPGPRYITRANAENQAADTDLVTHHAFHSKTASPPFTGGTPVSGYDLLAADSLCRQAGLNCDWNTVRARCMMEGMRLPGWDCGPGPTYVEFVAVHPKHLRAWAARYAPDLIDVNAEQPNYAVTWGWW